MPASPLTLLKPFPNTAPQLPLWKGRLSGLPRVLPRLFPQAVVPSFTQFMGVLTSVVVVVVTPCDVDVDVPVTVLHSPFTTPVAPLALDSEVNMLSGSVMSRA